MARVSAVCVEKECTNLLSSSVTAVFIRTLIWLEAAIDTVLSCIQDDGTDSIGGHRLKLHYEKFSCFLPLAFNQLIARIEVFVCD